MTVPSRGAPEPVRVIVCGGRDFTDANYLRVTLDRIHGFYHPIALLINGGARGADHLAEQWAMSRGIPVARYEARWGEDGRAAGPLRNARMLREGRPDLVIAFPGGRGTEDMIRRSESAGVAVLRPNRPKDLPSRAPSQRSGE